MRLVITLAILALVGCDMMNEETPEEVVVQTDQGSVALALAEALAPPAITAPMPETTATSIEEFDTTSVAERAAADAEVIEEDIPLGTTIASLGAPTDPGIWLETPLVTALTPGRITYQGTSINVELRPSGGAPGSGSQISLAAMRLIGAPLTSLPELMVFANAP